MTSIACGGGPTIEQRRDFAGLKDGSHLPGYVIVCLIYVGFRVGNRVIQMHRLR